MPKYEVDFSYVVEEFGTVEIDADNIEQATLEGAKYVKETYEDVLDVSIDGVNEVVVVS